MLSGAGRNRRNSANTVSATMPSTVISPSVSKPRKSTRITLITLAPPASDREFSMKKGEMPSPACRVSTAKLNAAMPAPAMIASPRSRSRRVRARTRAPSERNPSSIDLKRGGSQRKPRRIRTSVTISTTSCVNARSGAENQTNVMQVANPAAPARLSAARRWYLA